MKQQEAPMATGTAGFQLLQWKYAIRMEQRGMRHSSGRSVRKHAALALGLKANAKADEVIAAIEAALAA